MAGPKRTGLKQGPTKTEFTIFGKVKPGHGEALREEFRRSDLRYGGQYWKMMASIGTLHEARIVLFDNDTRFLFSSSFDGDWDTYIEDFAKGKMEFDRNFSHFENWPGISTPDAKDWFHANQQEALGYFSASDAAVKEVLKALELQKAFQQVLDDPAAAKALADPALKPLLDQAAK